VSHNLLDPVYFVNKSVEISEIYAETCDVIATEFPTAGFKIIGTKLDSIKCFYNK